MQSQDRGEFKQRLQHQIPPEEHFDQAKGYSEAAIKQGTWITTSLWNDYGWSEILNEYDITWQEFMKAFRWLQYDFLKWQKGRKDWEAVLNEFIDQIIEEASA